MDLETSALPDSEAIRRLEAEHRHYSEQLENLLQKPYLSEEELIQEVRLKKLKLHTKDLITARRSNLAVVA